MSGPGWKRAIGLGVAVAGAAAAATVGGLAAQRTRAARKAGEGELHQLGSLRSQPHTVVADDGVPLHVEVDEPGRGVRAGAPTLVFVHGYTLDLDCWHFQRAAFRGRFRMVFYDQRSHGRSGRSDAAHSTTGPVAPEEARSSASTAARSRPSWSMVLWAASERPDRPWLRWS